MKVLIEALGIHDYGGGRTATLNLMRNLLALDTETPFRIALTRPEPTLLARNLQQIILPVKNRFLARLWAQAALPALARGCEVVHCVKNLGLFGLPAPMILTIYDVSALLHPELYPRSDVWYWRTLQRRSLREASRLIAISQNTAAELRRFYDVQAEKLHVIYPSVAAHFRPAAEGDIARVRKKYGLPRRYLLHVGRIDRKNRPSLAVEAFARYRQRHPRFEGALVIVGGVYRKSPDASLQPAAARADLAGRVVFTGRVPDSDLPPLYSGAQAVLMTSQHEGFGLVAVEALACGAPLIAGHVGALPEVVGEAAHLVKPLDAETIAEAIAQVMGDELLRVQLRRRGLERARRYQGDHDARQTLALYRQVAGTENPREN